MKNIILSAIAAAALFATQASAQSYYSYGSPYYGTYGGYYGGAYSVPAGPYINIGSLDNYTTSYGGIVAAGYRTGGYVRPYAYPATTRYSYPSYSYPSTSYSYPYTTSSYSYPYSYGYGSSYITPASYRGVVSTVPYTNYGTYGCRC